MNAQKMGLLSIVTASLCCVGPVLLAVLGLGGLGVGASIGTYHWYFIAIAAVLLAMSWFSFLREKRRCETERCQMVGGKLSRTVLPIATLAVVAFFGLNLYTYAGDGGGVNLVSAVYAETTTIPVEGMTCFSCTVHVETSLKELDGVGEVKASVPNKTVMVSYDPAKISVNALVEAVNKTGYRATLPDKAKS